MAIDRTKLEALASRLEKRKVTHWVGDSWGGYDETYPDADCVEAAKAIRMLLKHRQAEKVEKILSV